MSKNKRNKYFAIKTVVDGVKFDSKKEASRYKELKILLSNKLISDLNLQVKYDLIVEGVKICRYIADFTYRSGNVEIVEDVKAILTPVYKLKKKLMLAIFKINILET